MKSKLSILFLFVLLSSFAQQSNKFLDRKFWKTKPTVNDVKTLISEGNSLTEKNRHAMDAVSYAILENAPNEVVKYMINTGLDVNTLTHDKRNYIFWAAYKDNLELMKFLKSKGSRTDITDSTGYNLIQFAAVTGNSNPKIYDYIIENGGDILSTNKKGKNVALLYAGKMKDLAMLDYFAKKGVNLKAIDNKGNGIFTYAAKAKNKEILEGLIAKGFDYKPSSLSKENAFVYATAFAHRSKATTNLALLTYLEGLGLDPKFVTKEGNTALHNVAFSSKDPEVISYFINRGVSLEAKNEKGNTAFMNACYGNSKEILSLLFKEDINVTNKKGMSALTQAVRRNKPEIVSYLIENGADVTILDAKKKDLLFHLVAAQRGQDMTKFNKKLSILKANNFKVNSKNTDLLIYAVKKGKMQVVKELISLGFDLNQLNKEGMSPLHVVAMTAKKVETVKQLIDMGAKKSIKTTIGETVYELASSNEVLKGENLSFLK